MKALVCTEPGRLEYREVGAPERKPEHVLVRPRRVGICGTDYHIYEGAHPFLQYPRVMGHELAVEILEVPANSGFATGEICAVNPYISCDDCHACRAGKPNCCMNISVLGVHSDGGMAERMSLPAKNILKAPGLTVDACACVEFLAIGAHAVRRAGIGANAKVLVVGAGPIGLGAALFARIAGGNPVLLDLDRDRALSASAIAGTDYLRCTDGESPLDAMRALTNGDGFDIVLDATGNAKAIEGSFDFVAHGGHLVLISVVNSRVSFSDPDFHRREMTLSGSRNATSEDFEHVIRSIRQGLVPVGELITHRTCLAEAATNLPHWAKAKEGLIKAVIELD
ncbi:zinc-binding alcohol dehydrogenase family protein [Roseibium sp. Sym1]|uniref:zinc-binding alcohol dehydrogenase family protein n=1 Tax=Roseibium sp. Sym1 TaxID=3016006 RepID=UPI0022B2ED8C|nr:zinc-binding alcohol dehydrogenase family protein [Roseibium sp. Sym1]